MATKRMIEVYDNCTICNKLLHSIAEGQRGTCASCWMSAMKPETAKALRNLIASAFNGSDRKAKEKAVADSFEAMRNDPANKPNG